MFRQSNVDRFIRCKGYCLAFVLVLIMSALTCAQGKGCASKYIVKAGDTLGSIAAAHQTTVQALLSANPSITDPDKIWVGQQLCIPAPLDPVDCKNVYTVKPGDTLGSIASAQQVTLQALLAANPSITDPSKIYVGQQICIPDGGVPVPPATPTPEGSLYSGSGSATYYYDVKTHCPQDPGGYPETDGYPACASYTPGPDQQTLRQINSNNVVAIDMNFLGADRAALCGKEVTVTYNGEKVTPPDGGSFFVWDGCAACVGGGRLDFSVSGARQVQKDACWVGVVPGISWSVSHKQVKKFVY